jgi:hypothetical protein
MLKEFYLQNIGYTVCLSKINVLFFIAGYLEHY